MKINPAVLNKPDVQRLLFTAISPRPIAWVSTVDKRGINNLAPFASYAIVSTVPAVVGVGISRSLSGEKKDTLRNIESSKEFVLNLVTEDLAEAMNITSAFYPFGVSEFEKAKLTPVKSELVAPARVGESPLSLECRVLQILEFGKEPLRNSFIIGEVLLVHVKDDLWNKGMIDSSGLNLVGRMGGGPNRYCRTRDIFEMKKYEF